MDRVSSRLSTSASPATPTGLFVRVGVQALAAVLAGYVAMGVVAGLGLWAAGAADLPGGFVAVLAAVVVMAAGGKVDLSGDAGALAGTQADLTAMPLTVTLVGALVTGYCFLRPLRHHAVAGTRELLLRAATTVVLWLVALACLSAVARHDFPLTIGGDTSADTSQDSLADLFGELVDAVNPTVGFRTDVGPTLFYGLLWILGVLAVALLVSRRTPLPPRLVRYHEPVRPAAHAMLLLLLAYVAVGLVIGIVVAATKGHVAETLAVLLLGLPNVSWLALGVGIGGSWEGKAEGPFGLPMPQVLDAVLREGKGTDLSTVDLSSLAAEDARAWWLLPVAAVLVLGAAFAAAVRSPARTRLWQHSLHLGIAFALTMLVVTPLTLVEARFGLSILGIGDLDALGGQVVLRPNVWRTVGFALLWGLVFGFLGGLLASRVHRKGEVEQEKTGPVQPPGPAQNP
ncbi:streptophobe family protein [Streptomyces sp. NPDC056169]|uniref:streptophobe family protein n=1 Tax=Streptomyces sp. NPDC056169 TaxID=3345734 RepID=UPI0035DECDE1